MSTAIYYISMFISIYLTDYISLEKLVTVVKGDPKAPFL